MIVDHVWFFIFGFVLGLEGVVPAVFATQLIGLYYRKLGGLGGLICLTVAIDLLALSLADVWVGLPEHAGLPLAFGVVTANSLVMLVVLRYKHIVIKFLQYVQG